MKLKINLEKLPPTYDSLIIDRLEKKNLPSCMGGMLLPILNQIEEIEDTDIIAPTESIPEINRANVDLTEVCANSDKVLTGNSMTVSGLKHILAFKESKANAFVDQCEKCINCTYIEVCNNLTRNTLQSFAIMQSLSIKGVSNE